MSFKQFLTTSAALAFAATTTFADEDQQMNEAGISVDGYIGIENESGDYESTSVIVNVLLSYKTNDWTSGIGKELDEFLENNEIFNVVDIQVKTNTNENSKTRRYELLFDFSGLII